MVTFERELPAVAGGQLAADEFGGVRVEQFGRMRVLLGRLGGGCGVLQLVVPLPQAITH
ncbi:hypothetical protein [Neomicrococcus lactis]|uniref:hypothetical protein n=1 Tax=Neomicrococcus lactis TaxID=732241 RepID=UPI0023004550|nr:hypothetical protein [Neomicrococcus lactis]